MQPHVNLTPINDYNTEEELPTLKNLALRRRLKKIPPMPTESAAVTCIGSPILSQRNEKYLSDYRLKLDSKI